MDAAIHYNNPGLVDNAITLPSNITTTEADLFKTTDPKFLSKSQLTIYASVSPGSSTGIKLRYYFSPDGGTTWYPLPVKNTSTGVLTDTPSELTSASFVDGNGNWVAIDEVPMPACTAFKITGTSLTASATALNSLKVMTRDN